jgi:threonine/homoserine/homoserine lactone efflux protein
MTLALLTFAVAGGALVVLPGPDSLLILRSIVLKGRATALRTAAGILTGLVVWAVAAAVGLAALLEASDTGYTVLRLAGAAYLLTLGVRALRRRHDAGDAAESGSTRGGLLGTGFVAGLATNLLNPKVGVFFVTFLPGFIPHEASVGATSLLLGGIYVLETAIYFLVLLLLVERISAALRRRRVRRALDRVTGAVLVAFGLRLAVEH